MAASSTYLSPKTHRYFSGDRSSTPTTVSDLLFEFSEFDIFNVSSSPEFHKSIKTSLKSSSPETNTRRNRITGGRTTTAMSLPVDVPNWSMILKQTTEKRRCNDGFDYDELDTDLFDIDDVIPPHEYLAKERIASLSVHEGIGRTLKGRDLSRVRNAVWKKIGFED